MLSFRGQSPLYRTREDRNWKGHVQTIYLTPVIRGEPINTTTLKNVVTQTQDCAFKATITYVDTFLAKHKPKPPKQAGMMPISIEIL